MLFDVPLFIDAPENVCDEGNNVILEACNESVLRFDIDEGDLLTTFISDFIPLSASLVVDVRERFR